MSIVFYCPIDMFRRCAMSYSMTLKRVLGEVLFTALEARKPKSMAAFVRECVSKELVALGLMLPIAPPKRRGRKPLSIFKVKVASLKKREYRARVAESQLEDRILHKDGPSRVAHAIRVPRDMASDSFLGSPDLSKR